MSARQEPIIKSDAWCPMIKPSFFSRGDHLSHPPTIYGAAAAIIISEGGGTGGGGVRNERWLIQGHEFSVRITCCPGKTKSRKRNEHQTPLGAGGSVDVSALYKSLGQVQGLTRVTKAQTSS